jgi:hypothetical protein
MFRTLRIFWKVLRALPLITVLALTAYTTAYFTLPQERAADEDGRVVRIYESNVLDRMFQPATSVENRLLDWWHDGQTQVETSVKKNLDLAVGSP